MGEEKRKSVRYKTYAKVLVEGSGVLGYLRDLSNEGCQLALIGELGVDAGETISVEVLPAEEMEIARFCMDVKIMWSRNDPVYFIVGGMIITVDNRKTLTRLLDYYT